jgi:hypothetical protein
MLSGRRAVGTVMAVPDFGGLLKGANGPLCSSVSGFKANLTV